MSETPPSRDPNRPAKGRGAYYLSRLAAAGLRAKWQTKQAARVVTLRPTLTCICTSWNPCTAYYNKGWYAYCRNCGTYSPC